MELRRGASTPRGYADGNFAYAEGWRPSASWWIPVVHLIYSLLVTERPANSSLEVSFKVVLNSHHILVIVGKKYIFKEANRHLQAKY
jgi:hypothetical protein